MTTRRLHARAGFWLPVLLVGLLMGVAACSGDSDKATLTPEQTMSAAKKKLDATSGVHLKLATDDLPTGVDGLLEADGVGTHDPAFQGGIKVAASGVTANVPVVAVDGTVYAKLPFTTSYTQIDPKDYTAPDPASLMSDHGGLSSLLTSAEHVTKGKQTRDGDQVLTTYTGTVPGDLVSTIIPSADPHGKFDATFTVTADNELAKAVLTGPFYPKADDVTYTITFDKYGTVKDITAP